MAENKFFRLDGFSRRFLFAAGVSLAGGVLWLSSCATPPEDATATNSASNANSLAPRPSEGDKATPNEGVNYILFVPNSNATLSKQIVRDTRTPVATTYEQKAQRALELLWKKLEFLPEDTRLLGAPEKEKNGVVRLNFSKQFLQLDKSPETYVLLIMDSIARTLGALESKNGVAGKSARVLVTVEGKALREFNQFSLAEPWEASETEPPSSDQPADNNVSDNKVTDNKISNSKVFDEKTGGGV